MPARPLTTDPSCREPVLGAQVEQSRTHMHRRCGRRARRRSGIGYAFLRQPAPCSHRYSSSSSSAPVTDPAAEFSCVYFARSTWPAAHAHCPLAAGSTVTWRHRLPPRAGRGATFNHAFENPTSKAVAATTDQRARCVARRPQARQACAVGAMRDLTRVLTSPRRLPHAAEETGPRWSSKSTPPLRREGGSPRSASNHRACSRRSLGKAPSRPS